MKTKPKLLKPRVFIPIIVLILFLTGCIAYMLFVGRTNTVTLNITSMEYIPNSAKATIVGDEAVKVKSVTEERVYDDIRITVKTESVGSGRDTLYLNFEVKPLPNEDGYSIDGQYPTECEYRLVTLPFGIIINRTLDSVDGIECLIIMLAGVMMITALAMIFSVLEKQREGLFSYSMVVRCGLIIYLLICSYIFLDEWRHNIKYGISLSFRELIKILFDTGRMFASITILPLLLLAFALAVSNIQLVRKEGFRPLNLLGILLGVSLIGGIWMIYRLNSSVNYENDVAYHTTTFISIAFAFVFCYFECMLLSTMLCAVMCTRYKPPYNLDYIIILGCAIRADGTPTPLLKGRIDRAIKFENEQFEKTGKHSVFVPSGGQGSDEIISEAQSMKDYLLSQGIPDEQVVMENKSVNTYQNMLFSKGVIQNDSKALPDVNIGFSTTNYHVFRGYTLANRIKMKVGGLSAKTRLYFFPNAFIREFIGLVWEQKLRHFLFIFFLVAGLAILYFVINYL